MRKRVVLRAVPGGIRKEKWNAHYLKHRLNRKICTRSPQITNEIKLPVWYFILSYAHRHSPFGYSVNIQNLPKDFSLKFDFFSYSRRFCYQLAFMTCPSVAASSRTFRPSECGVISRENSSERVQCNAHSLPSRIEQCKLNCSLALTKCQLCIDCMRLPCSCAHRKQVLLGMPSNVFQPIFYFLY